MNLSDYKVTKFMCGFFFDTDFTYSQKKGTFFNKVRSLFNINDLNYLENTSIGDLLVSKKEKFQLKLTKTSLHFEGKFNKNDFQKISKNLFTIYNDVFKENKIEKIGFVVFFEHKNSFKEDLFGNYIKSISIDPKEIKATNIRLNYNLKKNNMDYNVFCRYQNDFEIVDKVTSTQKSKGELDFNLMNVSKGFTEKQVKQNFTDLYDYYKNDLMKIIGL